MSDGRTLSDGDTDDVLCCCEFVDESGRTRHMMDVDERPLDVCCRVPFPKGARRVRCLPFVPLALQFVCLTSRNGWWILPCLDLLVFLLSIVARRRRWPRTSFFWHWTLSTLSVVSWSIFGKRSIGTGTLLSFVTTLLVLIDVRRGPVCLRDDSKGYRRCVTSPTSASVLALISAVLIGVTLLEERMMSYGGLAVSLSALTVCIYLLSDDGFDEEWSFPPRHCEESSSREMFQCRHCEHVEVVRSARHCRFCGCCVVRFDHHCEYVPFVTHFHLSPFSLNDPHCTSRASIRWLDTCIGFRNHTSFLAFLLAIVLHGVNVLWFICEDTDDTINIRAHVLVYTASLFFLLIKQIRNASEGLTTYETITGSRYATVPTAPFLVNRKRMTRWVPAGLLRFVLFLYSDLYGGFSL